MALDLGYVNGIYLSGGAPILAVFDGKLSYPPGASNLTKGAWRTTDLIHLDARHGVIAHHIDLFARTT